MSLLRSLCSLAGLPKMRRREHFFFYPACIGFSMLRKFGVRRCFLSGIREIAMGAE